ncbi:reverse transcriptase domain, reverse transcriptase zinc-binding domain protein [Tanacetum coccineum]
MQETKSGPVDDYWINDWWGGKDYGYAQLPAIGNSGGIILVWDLRVFICKEAVGNERFVAVRGSWKGKYEEYGMVLDMFMAQRHLRNRMRYGFGRIEVETHDGGKTEMGIVGASTMQSVGDGSGTKPRDRMKNVKVSLRAWSKERFSGTKETIGTLKNEAMRWELEARNNKCNIRGLMVDGVWCEDPKVIKAEMARHYKRLFFEGKEAIRGCGGDKAPGPDGFNFKFIRRVWEIIRTKLLGAIRWFWEYMEISRGCNASFVTIIPKVAGPIWLGYFHPISLIGCYYKIIAKKLVERIKRVVGIVVGEAQNVFIKGRYILDEILIANEAMEYLQKKKIKILIFKVDFEKAYDSINWRFLIDIMKKMGFGDKWCKWVDSCLRSASMSILVNGSPSDEFGLERGIRQGDPLSPFLFILAAKGLNAIVNEAVENDIFRGVKVGTNNVTVSHLQYADDNIFFGEWSKENTKALMCVLKCFEEVFGLRVITTKVSYMA